MANYSYKRVRELLPALIEDKYRAEWEESHKTEGHKQSELHRLITDCGNTQETAERLYAEQEWFWNNDYDGDLFDGAADYIIELKSALSASQARDAELREKLEAAEAGHIEWMMKLPVVAYLKTSNISGDRTLSFSEEAKSQTITNLVAIPPSPNESGETDIDQATRLNG